MKFERKSLGTTKIKLIFHAVDFEKSASIDASFTTVGLVRQKKNNMQISRSQNTSQNSISTSFSKRKKFGCLCYGTREDLSIDASFTTVN